MRTHSNFNIFSDVMPCGPLKVNRRFGFNFRVEEYPGFLLATYPPKYLLTFNRLHAVISRIMELFLTTALRTSNPIHPNFFTGRTVERMSASSSRDVSSWLHTQGL
jgi:hypothetical protein